MDTNNGSKLFIGHRAAWRAIARMLAQSDTWFSLAFLLVINCLLLQWLFSLDALKVVFFDSVDIAVSVKIRFMIEIFFDLFESFGNFVPTAIVLIAAFQSIALLILLRIRREQRSLIPSTALGLIGSGCVACGGSVLSPLFSLLASSVSVSTVRVFGRILLLLAIVLSYRSMIKLGQVYGRISKQDIP